MSLFGIREIVMPQCGTTGNLPTSASIAHGVQMSVTGIQTRWAPGMLSYAIRGAAIKLSVTSNSDAVIVGFNADITTQGTPTRMFTIAVPTTNGGHSIYYNATYNILVKPGMTVEGSVTAAATAGIYGVVSLLVEPTWDQPSNVTTMTKTT